MTEGEIAGIDFAKGAGLIPVIVQDSATLQVLMLAYMDEAALRETLASSEATFFSRSRNARWRKGETSGHRMKVKAITPDCDRDTLLLRVTPAGPACHRGTTSCFGEETAPGVGRLAALERTIAARESADPAESHTARLLSQGPKRAAQKVGEEAVETALAGAAGPESELRAEAADLLYHLLVLLRARNISLRDVCGILEARAKV